MLLLVSICLLSVTISSAQSLPILNGSAILLPHPEYLKEFKDLCAYGEVSVRVVVSPGGAVEEANAVTGDPILYDSAITAARKAEFKFNVDGPPIKHTGLVIYSFPTERKCIDAGVVNKKTISIPKPDLTKVEHLSARAVRVEVRIIVDMLTGRVKFARAYSGYIFYFAVCERSARNARFSPVFVDGKVLDVKATLVYKFNPDGSIEY
jgi:hypothetical protein